MATTNQVAEKRRVRFHRQMSTDDLVSWLRDGGLGHNDCDIIKDNGFTGESFLLLEKSEVKGLGIKLGGQIMLTKLKKVAEEICIEDDSRSFFDTHSTVPNDDDRVVVVPPASTVITNDLRESSTTVGAGTVDTQEMRESPEPSTKQQGEEDVTREPQSPVSQAQASGDGFREDEEVVPVYCTQGLESGTSVFSFDHAVHMYRNKIWAGRELLKVNFLNPAVLKGWGLTADVVLDWAKAWDTGVDKVPKFKQVASATRADIRVLLSGTQGCSSMIGMDAEKVRSVAEPTMVLNLRGLPLNFQRSLVIHEFGHALGLDHEHQRSDFWDVVGGHFDVKRIPQEQHTRVFKKSNAVDKDRVLGYDPNSIMHYWFDLTWLRNPRHRIRGNIEGDNILQETDKQYLLGMHKRQGGDKLPNNPSIVDTDYLVNVYVNNELRQVSPVNPGTSKQLSLGPSHAAPSPHNTTTAGQAPRNPQYNNIDIMGTVLKVNVHKREILNTIWDARAKWRVIGQHLGLSDGDLDAIHTRDCGTNLDSVLVLWINKGNKYIGQLMDVLRSPAVGRADLAENIMRTK